MTPLATRRAEVAQAVATHLVDPSLRQYLAAHPQTRDADGEPVILAHDPDEGMDEVITAKGPHDHPVMLATLVDGNVFVCILGATAAPGTAVPTSATPIHTDASTTVAELARMIIPLPEGAEFVVTYQAAAQEQHLLVGSV